MKKLLVLGFFLASMTVIGSAFAHVEKQKSEKVDLKYESYNGGGKFEVTDMNLAVAGEMYVAERPITNSEEVFFAEPKAEVVTKDINPSSNDPPVANAAN